MGKTHQLAVGGLADCSRRCYGRQALLGAMPLQPPHRIYKITYQRPWGVCTINTAQFKTEDELRIGFTKSYPGCELLSVEDVTTYFFPANK